MGILASDVREFLEGYDLEERSEITYTGTLTAGSYDIVMDSVDGLLDLMLAAGTGIPASAKIADITGLTVTLDKAATISGSQSITFTTYTQLSDSWLTKRRDGIVLPWIKRKTGIDVAGVQRVTEYYNGTGSTILVLNHRPIIEVHSINLVTNPSNWVYVSPTSVDKVTYEGILKLKTVLETWQPFVPAFPRGKYNIKVDYTYGFAAIPAEVEEAINEWVAMIALQFIGARTGGGALSTQGYSRNFGEFGKYTDIIKQLSRNIMALLRPYMTGMTG